MFPVTFSYPAFSEPRTELTIRAQLNGDVDASTQKQQLLFTMDGRSYTRTYSKFSKVLSNWQFRTVANIEDVRSFFRNGEGQYFKYDHYDMTEWNFILIGGSYNVVSSNGRISYMDNGVRKYSVTHDFTLVVERWAR